MFLPGSVKVCLFGVNMTKRSTTRSAVTNIRQLVLVCVFAGFFTDSALAGQEQYRGKRGHGPHQIHSSFQKDKDLDKENPNYPVHPHPEMTPGDLCKKASAIRYPERIKYCERN